jgi:hypothetical protein
MSVYLSYKLLAWCCVMGMLALYGSIVDEIGSILEANTFNCSDGGCLVPSVMQISHQMLYSSKFKPHPIHT